MEEPVRLGDQALQPSKDDTTLALLAHLSMFVGGFVGPLIIWLIKKDESPFVDQHGREALNFSISLMIWSFITVLLCFILIGFVLVLGLAIMSIVCPIMAALAANEGRHYRYPLTIRFL